jgi:putative nucleotidyltransferase with HDIG domain
LKRDDAIALLHEFTKGDSLRKHGLAVEAAMRAYARKYGGDEETWGMVGLLHDFDYEAYPTAEDHPFVGARVMRERGWPEEIVEGVLAHASYTGVARDTPLKRTIFAVDELTGLITATALMYGRDLRNLDASKVRKKLKDKSFARGVIREDIYEGVQGLGVDLDEHIRFVLEAMQAVAPELGLDGRSS